MKVAISGASGFVGQHLASIFQSRGDDVVTIGRRDYQTDDTHALQTKLAGCEMLINLSGAPIIAKWTEEHKQALRSSRIDTTRKLVEALHQMESKPKLFISTSAVGIYDNRGTYGESDCNYGDDLLACICKDWEEEALKAGELGIRTAVFRFGIVLGKNGGMIQKVLTPFSLGLGGPIGNGQQAFSWIHIDDLAQAYLFALENQEVNGVYNLTAPHPIDNLAFTKALGHTLGRPTWFPVPPFVLKLMFGEGAKVMTDGQSVKPERLLESGFAFRYPTINEALEAIVK